MSLPVYIPAKLYAKSEYGILTSGMAVYHEGVFWVEGYEKEKLYEDRYRSNASSVRGFTMDVTFSLCFWCTRGQGSTKNYFNHHKPSFAQPTPCR